MENQLTAESISEKISEDTDVNIQKSIAIKISVSELPNWSKADISLQNKIQSVVKRLDAYHSILSNPNSENEKNVNLSLRIQLLLTCINSLGEISRTDTPLSFLSWLDTSNSVTIKSIREEAINKTINSIGYIDDEKKAVKLIKSVFAQYKLNNSVESNFFSFFTDAIDNDTQNKIASNNWIYQDNPLEKWASLQNVKEGYSNTTTIENKRLTNARKRWDSLDSYQKLFEISQFAESLFNQFNLCQENQPVELEKDPIAKVWRDIEQSVRDHKINYLSDSLFNQLGVDGQKFKFNEVRCVFKDEDLIVYEGDVREKDRDTWLKRLSDWLKTKIDSGSNSGEAIFLFSKNQALVLSENNLESSLNIWIDKAIRNILNKK